MIGGDVRCGVRSELDHHHFHVGATEADIQRLSGRDGAAYAFVYWKRKMPENSCKSIGHGGEGGIRTQGRGSQAIPKLALAGATREKTIQEVDGLLPGPAGLLRLATITPAPILMPPGGLGWDPSPVFMPVISQPSQFTATATCSPQTSRHTACQAH